jgi:chaperonin GroES
MGAGLRPGADNNIQLFRRERDTRMASLNLRPLGDRVVVKPLDREEVTTSGIVLPDTAKEKPQQGEVLAVGPGRVLDSGDRVEPDVKKGERVLFAKYSGTEFKLDQEELLILRESDILAIVTTNGK